MHMYRRIVKLYVFVTLDCINLKRTAKSGTHNFGGTTPPCCPVLNEHTYFTISVILESVSACQYHHTFVAPFPKLCLCTITLYLQSISNNPVLPSSLNEHTPLLMNTHFSCPVAVIYERQNTLGHLD